MCELAFPIKLETNDENRGRPYSLEYQDASLIIYGAHKKFNKQIIHFDVVVPKLTAS